MRKIKSEVRTCANNNTVLYIFFSVQTTVKTANHFLNDFSLIVFCAVRHCALIANCKKGSPYCFHFISQWNVSQKQ